LPDDLLVLCDECHRTQHGVAERRAQTRGMRPISAVMDRIFS
jgi:type I site-specific restriction-modification system R (restriction) subunit